MFLKIIGTAIDLGKRIFGGGIKDPQVVDGLRNLTRPILSFGVMGLFTIGILIQYVQTIFGHNIMLIDPLLYKLAKWVVAFWFCSRGLEKIIRILK